MSLIDMQNFLARIYTDEKLRREFATAPERIGKDNNLTDGEIAEISENFFEEINFFAESLFRKRLREAEKLLPLTKKILNGEFEKLFRQFSGAYKSQTIKKHLADAVEFCRFLQRIDSLSEIGKDAAKYEKAKISFFNYGERFVFCRLNFDFRDISLEDSKTQSSDLNNKNKFAVWFRYGNKIKHFYIELPL